MRQREKHNAPERPQSKTSSARAGCHARPWPVNLDDFEMAAKRRLAPMAFAYIAGGAGDERTLRRNSEAFGDIRLKPRVLVDVSQRGHQLTAFRRQSPHPILLAPTAYHKLSHREGELATARGAARGVLRSS